MYTVRNCAEHSSKGKNSLLTLESEKQILLVNVLARILFAKRVIKPCTRHQYQIQVSMFKNPKSFEHVKGRWVVGRNNKVVFKAVLD